MTASAVIVSMTALQQKLHESVQAMDHCAHTVFNEHNGWWLPCIHLEKSIHSCFNHDNHTWSYYVINAHVGYQHSCTLPVKAFIACSPLMWPAAAQSAQSSSAIFVIRGMYCSLVLGLNADRNILRMLRCCCPFTMARVFWPKMVPMVKGQSSAGANKVSMKT